MIKYDKKTHQRERESKVSCGRNRPVVRQRSAEDAVPVLGVVSDRSDCRQARKKYPQDGMQISSEVMDEYTLLFFPLHYEYRKTSKPVQ